MSWIIAGQLLTANTQLFIRNELVELDKQADSIAGNAIQTLDRFQGYAQLVALRADVLRGLADQRHGSDNAKLTVAQRKRAWSLNPQLLKVNQQLAQMNSILGTGVLYVMNATGDCILSSNADKPDSFVGANFAQRPYFQMARDGKRGFQYAVGKISNIPGLYLSTPIRSGGKTLGVAAVKINMDDFMPLIKQADAYVSDKYGVIILAHDKNMVMRVLTPSDIEKLSREARLARYKRAEFETLNIGQWSLPNLPGLKYFAHENLPLLIAERHIAQEDIAIHLTKHLHSVSTFGRDRLFLGVLLAFLGGAMIIGIRQRFYFVRRRGEFEKNERIALEHLQMRDKALEQISQGVLISDANRLTTYINPGFEKMTGYSLEEMAGRPSAILQGPGTDAETVRQILAAMDEAQSFDGEILNYRKDGSTFWNELSIDPVFNAAGELVQFVSVQRDVTENVQARTSLQLKEFALNAAVNALVIMDTRGRVEWINSSFSKMTGYTLDEVTGNLLDELHSSHPQSDKFLEQVWQHIHSDQVWRGELLNRRKDGSLYLEDISIAPVKNEQGIITKLFAVKQDITQRKALERDLRDSKDALYRMLNFMEEGAFEIDVLGKCKFANRASLKFLGYQEDSEFVGKNIHELIQHTHADGSHFPVAESKLLLVIQTHQLSTSSDEVFWRKDGAFIPVEFWSHAIEMDGVVVGAIVTFMDISQRILIERERNNLLTQLLGKNRLLQDYRERVKEEESVARDFLKQFCALDKISDPLVQFALKPAENFSGDLIAFARTPDDRLHLLLADSAGHGLTAALAVIPLTQPFYQMTAKGFDLAAIAKEINRRVRDYLQLPRYVACALVSLDAENQLIQVWNGGCPDLLLLSDDGTEILHRFVSNHLPMGLVKPENFTPTVELYSYEGRQCKLLACSDGATELSNGDGGMMGYGGLLQRAQQSRASAFFERLVDVVDNELKGIAPQDDIAIVVAKCAAAKEDEGQTLQLTSPENNLPPSFQGFNFTRPLETEWQYSITLTAPQLKRLDVVPFLLGVTAQMDGEKARSKVFLVLSELFNNALDHGILKLKSSLKQKTEDMEAYYNKRCEHLDKLEQGKIEIDIEKFRCDSGYMMKIHCKDSGEGFDFSAIKELGNTNKRKKRHGRGIPLLKATCNALQYLGNGSEVIAYMELTAD